MMLGCSRGYRESGDRGRYHGDSERTRNNARCDRADSRRAYRDRSYEKRTEDRRSQYSPDGYRQKGQYNTADRSSSHTASGFKSGWDEMADEYNRQTDIIQGELDRYKRKLHRSDSTGSYKQQNNSKADACETDQVTLMRRQKQIDYGKNTLAYDNYSQHVPRHSRSKNDPWTPTKFAVCSRRAWDGRIKEWRKKLHNWDPELEKSLQQISVSSEGVFEEEACLDDVPNLELLDPMDVNREQLSGI